MKKLSNLKGAKALSKKEQQSINGGFAILEACKGAAPGDPCIIPGDPYGRSGTCVGLPGGDDLICALG